MPLVRRGGAEPEHALGLKGQAHVRDQYLGPALSAVLLELTIPDKPRSRLQKYRLTPSGRAVVFRYPEDAQ